MEVTLYSEDIHIFQRIYAEKPETMDWMMRFGSPFEKVIAEIIKIANEGKTGTWSLGATNTWIPVKYV